MFRIEDFDIRQTAGFRHDVAANGHSFLFPDADSQLKGLGLKVKIEIKVKTVKGQILTVTS
jgi:hypothetical protein